MNPGNTYKPYTAADIMRYLEGGMSSKEMHLLERLALEDPFLQDAIDGFKEALKANNEKAIAPYLNAAIAHPAQENRKKDAVVIPIWRRKIFQYAVAALLVGGTGWYIFSLTMPNHEIKADTDIVTENTSIATDSTSANVAPKTNDVAVNTQPIPPAAVTKKHDGFIATDKPVTSNLDDTKQLETSGNNAADEDIVAQNAPVKKPSSDASVSSPVPPPAVAKAETKLAESPAANYSVIEKKESASNEVRQKAMITNNAKTNYLVSGKTMDMEKYPLDNISVTVKGTNNAVVSDELGRFQLNLPDTVVTLVASAPGYKTREFTTNVNKQKLELELEPEPNSSLQEVVVSGYNSKRKNRNDLANSLNKPSNRNRPIVLDMDTTDAAPAGGWNNFAKYITQNKQLKNARKQVAVIISFEVDENGRPGNMDIIQSGGKEYDNEAFRLLKEGPNWINKTKEATAFAKITIVL